MALKIISSNQSALIDETNGAALTELSLHINGTHRQIINPQLDYLYSSSLLFPFPNRLANGEYTIHGKSYSFPLNDFGRPNALHGFLHDRHFSMTHQSQNSLTLIHRYEGDLPYYPFPFSFQITYTLLPAKLEVAVQVTNIGEESMPFGLGWHPYFFLSETTHQVKLKLPEVIQHELDSQGIPTGKEAHRDTFAQFTSLSDISLDDSFEIISARPSSFIEFEDNLVLEIWQDSQFPYLQVYTPDDRKSVAIEPMTCGVDAWNRNKSIPLLSAGETFASSFGATLHSNINDVTNASIGS